MDEPYLIVGLGNPGGEYAETRHNIGFMAVEALAARWGAAWKSERKFQARVAVAAVAARKVFLCEPLTFMNASGESIGALANFYRVPPDRVLVLSDDADLPLGQVRLRAGGSSGGHHGLESVGRHLGTTEFPRLKMGIGRAKGARQISDYVLAPFTGSERKLAGGVVEHAVRQAETWLTDGVQKAMNQFNGAIEGADEAKDTK